MLLSRTLRVSILGALALGALPLAAQVGGHLSGEVTGLPSAENRFQVVIRPLTADRVSHPEERVFVDLSGRFNFTRVPNGQYEFLLVGPDQSVVSREIVNVGDFAAPVQIRYRGPAQKAAPGGVVSMARLKHKVPKAAHKAYNAAGKHRDHKRFAEAEASYRQAIAIDPEYVEAYNDMGTLYYVMGRYADSLAALEAANKLSSNVPQVLANMSAALIALQRPAEAEPFARRAVALDSGRVRSRYLLGLSRAAQNKLDDETRGLLEEAATVIPRAHLALAYLYKQQGDGAAAERHQNLANSLR